MFGACWGNGAQTGEVDWGVTAYSKFYAQAKRNWIEIGQTVTTLIVTSTKWLNPWFWLEHKSSRDNTLVFKLEDYSLKGWITWQVKGYLDDEAQWVEIHVWNFQMSVAIRALQEPVLGTVLFDICVNNLEEISSHLQMTPNQADQLICSKARLPSGRTWTG